MQKQVMILLKMENNNEDYYEKIVENNFDKPDKIMKYLNQKMV